MGPEGGEKRLILKGVGVDGGRCFRLAPGSNGVGSLPGNRICLDSSGVSRRHAVVRLTEGGLTVEDLASKNGTTVNGEPVDRARLTVGDRVGFAAVEMRVEWTPAADGELAIEMEPPDVESGAFGRETPSIDPAPSPQMDLSYPDGWIPGRSPAMATLLSQVHALRCSELPVLVLGETGVGKEGVAQTVHLSSRRARGPFVAINCAAIPEDLLEAELFGIGAGVATGVGEREGRFLEAAGGTLFLDEIGDMPEGLQAKLLRVLQGGEVQPLGKQPQPFDARLVAATHGDLAAAVAAGQFRRDLFYRLAGAVLHVPPLRQRREDIPALVEHFCRSSARAASKDVRGFTVDALRRVVEHPWPGNVRELRHGVERWVHRCRPHQAIDAELLGQDLTSEHLGSGTPGAEPGIDPSALESLDLGRIESLVVDEALRRSEGNLTRAARALGLSRQSLRRRVARHDLKRSQSP